MIVEIYKYLLRFFEFLSFRTKPKIDISESYDYEYDYDYEFDYDNINFNDINKLHSE